MLWLLGRAAAYPALWFEKVFGVRLQRFDGLVKGDGSVECLLRRHSTEPSPLTRPSKRCKRTPKTFSNHNAGYAAARPSNHSIVSTSDKQKQYVRKSYHRELG